MNFVKLFQNKKGLEVGGPSRIFQDNGVIPLYKHVGGLDGCNFAHQTLWESGLQEGLFYKYHESKECGYQFICEATDLQSQIAIDYDFVISSNCLEHIANPLKAISQFSLVLKKPGFLLIVVPRKEVTFDHNRSITTYEHLYEDYINNVDEHDLTHLPEILELHDLSLDPPAGTKEQFKERSMDNFFNRGLHHHVFDEKLLKEVFTAFGIRILNTWNITSDYVILGKKI